MVTNKITNGKPVGEPQSTSMYVRVMRPGFAGETKWVAKVWMMGMVMDKSTFFSRTEAATWVSNKILVGGFDKVTIEAVEDESPGRA